ncbi:MAG: hypothetical protein WD490_09970 [Opitutales bacterium]
MQTISTLDEGLQRLMDTYGAPPSNGERPDANPFQTRRWLDASTLAGQNPEARQRVLFPWRMERRFLELRGLCENDTLGSLSTLRLARFVSDDCSTLPRELYRLLDLAEWLGGAGVQRLYAVGGSEMCANLIVRLAGGALVALEAGCSLPAGSSPLDRHELISTRGVASDRVVDTQIPQESVYVYDASGSRSHLDVDAELFGLTASETALVRAGYASLADPDLSARRRRHAYLNRLLEGVLHSMEHGTVETFPTLENVHL